MQVQQHARIADQQQLSRVINATGVVLHTGLGRAPLSVAARQALGDLGGHCNVEVDLETAGRRYRGHQLEATFRSLTGCEDVLIVNNNAAATLLTLQALCAGREVVISRGQLIEIGGSFRLPEIFTLSGAVLREIGTTNRTHVSDYQKALTANTAAVMHVHPSNFRVIGFSETPAIDDLVPLARKHGVIAIDDIGSGALIDVTQFGLPAEPTFQQSLAAGADVVLGSGDKLLGGPQCGIILGKHEFVERIRQHPLARAVRIGKLTLAALQATLDAYLRGAAAAEIPTLAMLSVSIESLRQRARQVAVEIGELPNCRVEIANETAAVGGGSLPGVELPTVVLRLRSPSISADELSRGLRLGSIRVCGRIQQDDVLLDLRSVLPEDDLRLALAVKCVLTQR
ncbi:L-seryl-tRNA(Sec) selenium transferase [Planctomycetia bacterium]|nr:L-seryl-tRNA(Sec) selenium transferase [Planctomycetia bacterium]